MGGGVLTPKTLLNPNENQTVIFRVSENPTVEVSSSYLQKCGLPKDQSRVRDNLFLCFCSRVDRIDPMILECHKRAHFDGN